MLLEIHHFLSDNSTSRSNPQPDSVSQESICWPPGTFAKLQQPDYCHQQHEAWLLNQHAPPTLQDSSLKQQQPRPFQFWLNQLNKREQPSCKTSELKTQSVALWPLRTEPWIDKKYTRHRQIPDWSDSCRKQPTLQDYRNLNIMAISPSAQLIKAGPMAAAPTLPLKATGGSGRYHWYINGLPNAEDEYSYRFEKSGAYQITVMDDIGNVDRVNVEVMSR